MYTIKEAIANLTEEIAEKQEQIAQLQQFDKIAKKGLTEQEYHNFCETDLRYSDVLGNSLLTVFPFLEYEKRGVNWFFYRLNDVQVCIPNSRCMGIDIVIPKLIPDLNKRIHSIKQEYEFQVKPLEKQLLLYQQYFQAKSDSERAKLMFPTYRTWFALLKFIALGRVASDKEMRKKQEEAMEQKAALEERFRLKSTEIADFEKSQTFFFKKYIPLFLKWTDTIRVQAVLNNNVAIRFKKGENGELMWG